MFTKIVSTVSVLLAVSAHVSGHTLMTPALGVQGAGARSDVQRLAKTGGCGDMDVASNIDTSTPVAAAADGTFTVTATNFNRLTDGSRQLTATMDSTGTGNNFIGAVTVTQNGDNRPKSLGSEQIVAALPAGTTCTGGASGNLCLVSFQNGARQGFGNCVVVSQGAATGAGAATGSTATAANAGTGASDTSAAGAATESTGAEAGTGTGASDTSAVGAATGSTGVAGTGAATGSTGVAGTGAATGSTGVAGTGAATGSTGVAGTGASDNSAVGASTGSAATSGTGVSAGNAAGTGVGAGVNGAASGAGAATSGSTTASTGQAISQAGSRAARALLAELEARGEDSLDLVRRGIVDWIWA